MNVRYGYICYLNPLIYIALTIKCALVSIFFVFFVPKFLEELNIMDYSLLLGIHNRSNPPPGAINNIFVFFRILDGFNFIFFNFLSLLQ